MIRHFTFLVIAMTLLMAGCASTDGARARLPVQYAVIKLIEQSSQVTPDDVVRHTARVRALVDRDAEISTADLVAQVMAGIDTAALDASDRLLLMAIVDQASQSLGEVNMLGEEHRLSLLALLGWIEQAARMAGSG